MLYLALAAPFVFLGAVTRAYSFRAGETCFYVDVVNWGEKCFGGAIIPYGFKYGCMAAGLVLLFAGYRQMRGSRRHG